LIEKYFIKMESVKNCNGLYRSIIKSENKRAINRIILGIVILVTINYVNAQVYTWQGSISEEFYDSLNWSPDTWNPRLPNGVGTVIIGKGNPNNPVFVIGGGKNPSRYNYLNTTHEADFDINGALYSWNNDSINGHVMLETYAEFNIRNIGYIGRENTATVTVSGILTTKYDLYVGYGNNGNALLSITDGAVYVGRTLYINQGGSNGHIKITGLGALYCAGDITTTLQSWVDNGTIYTDDPDQLIVEYDLSANMSKVSVMRIQTGLVREYDTYVVLDNGIIKATINKENAKITSLLYNGIETVSQSGSHVTVYYDWHADNTLEGPSHCEYSIVQESDTLADVSFKRVYKPGMGDAMASDMDIHFVIKEGFNGLYTYSVLEHPADYPSVPVSGWRMIYSLANDGHTYTCEKLYVDSLRHWEMPSIDDYNAGSATGIKEIIKLNTGVRAGHYDSKYEYVTDLWNFGTWGFASDINKIGTWIVLPSHEFFNLGTNYHDLNSAAGIIHVCLNSLHYNALGYTVPTGEHWRKIYGPYLLYFNNKETGDESWADAQKQAKTEESQWPYEWLKDNEEYPLANARGSVSGKFIVTDPYKPGVTGTNAWVGVTQISNSTGQWQFESKNYHYWAKTNADGTFTIPDIRPGTYTLYAYTDGEVGEYSKSSVVVTAGQETLVGDLNWDIPRNKGKLLWEIGIPDRSSYEFGHGHTDFFEGFVYDNFVNEFSNPIEYNVEEKNWDTALPYVHCPLKINESILNAWKWRLNFNIEDDIPTTGNATLTFAFASSDHAQLRVYVNDELSYYTYFYPDNAGGNALLRQSIHAMYATKTVQIPMNKLKKGENTISLVMPSTQSMVNHVMYDYISLEALVYDCNGDLNGPAIVDSCGNCAGGNTGKTPVLNPDSCEAPSHYDCNGELSGPAFIDSCGVCAGGNTGISPVLDSNLCSPSSNPETDFTSLINIYPNPSYTNFKLLVQKETQYVIYNLTGCKIEKGTCSGNCAVGNNLPQGTYLIKLMQADKGIQLKLVKY
jgi:T5SS/PEP-CTERM-associated repeat protein